jgi:hypothetical protein
MGKMSMPGFTATLSLERTSGGYVWRQVGSANRGVTGVVPSLYTSPRAPECLWPCRVINHTCVCPFG